MSTGGKSFRLRGDLIGRSVPCRCEGFMPTSLARQLCTWADEKIVRRRRGGGTETSPPPRFSDPTRKNKERKLIAPLPPEAAQRHPVRRRRAPAETTTKRIVQRSVAERAGTGNSARRTTISTSASSVNRLGANQNVTIMIFELRCYGPCNIRNESTTCFYFEIHLYLILRKWQRETGNIRLDEMRSEMN